MSYSSYDKQIQPKSLVFLQICLTIALMIPTKMMEEQLGKQLLFCLANIASSEYSRQRHSLKKLDCFKWDLMQANRFSRFNISKCL